MQIACFMVGQQEYGLDIMQIKEVIKPLPITPVPRALSFIEGIVELRGAILPVVDLRKRFGTSTAGPARDIKYAIVAIDDQIVGLVVDRVREVVRVDAAEVRQPPPMAVGPDARFFSGVCKYEDRIIMLLNVDEILTAAEKSELRGAGGRA